MNKTMIAMLTACFLGQVSAAEDNSTFDALFKQAEYWQDKNRNDLAKDSLQRVLNADPANLEAIYRMGLISAREGDDAQVQQWINRMAQIAPMDPRVKELAAAKTAESVDPATLAEARRLAATGQYEAALKRYQEVFGGTTPTQDLAPEYYLTLAGTAGGQNEAKQQLKKLHQSRPGYTNAKQAYAQVLSYAENSRREGITMLAEMAPSSAVAESSWRQALLWLNATSADKKYYDQYLSAHPNDLELMNYYQDKIQNRKAAAVVNSRTRGYQALNANKLPEAERLFRKALAENSKDAEAVAGLGLIELRQQKFAAAKQTLSQAIAMAPAKASSWRDAYQSAEFYGAMQSARQLMENQQDERALALIEPFTTTKGPRGYEAKVMAGQLQHKLGRLDDAMQSYNSVIQQNPSHTEAKLGLIAVLQSMGRWSDAERLAAQLSDSDRNKIAYVSQAEVQKLRTDAANTNDLLAEINLRRAMKLAPSDPWVRLDLARLVSKQGDDARARTIVEPLLSPSQPAESRYAAAMFASEQKRWADVERIMATITPAQRTPAMRTLAAHSSARTKFNAVIQRAAAGDQAGARQLLVDLYQSSSLGSKSVGELANELVNSDQTELAYQLVELDLMQGLDEKAGDYVNHVSVMNESGRSKQARVLMSDLMLRPDLTDEDRQSLLKLQQGLAVREADQLRNSGQMALAYDVLAARLREAPEDEVLLLAMARLYQSGEKPTEADQIYNYVLKLNPDSKDALSGAVNMALQQKQPDKAAELLARINWNNSTEPEMFVLAARVSQAKGDDAEAAALLLKARKLAYQDRSVWGSSTTAGLSANPFREPVETATNPFRDKRTSKKSAKSGIRPSWLPGQAIPDDDETVSTANRSATLFEEIDGMLLDLEQSTLTRIDTDVVLRVREGADGSSGLDSVETPLVVSTGAFGDDRAELTVTPTSLNSGTVTGEDINLYGRGSVVNAASGLSSRLEGLYAALDSVENLASAYNDAQDSYDVFSESIDDESPESDKLRQSELLAAANRAKANFLKAAEINFYEALGLTSGNLTGDQFGIVNNFIASLLEARGYSDVSLIPVSTPSDTGAEGIDPFLSEFALLRGRLENIIGDAQSSLDTMAVSTGDPETQRRTGVALGVAYKGEWIEADVGTTPLGFEKTNVVGGLKVQPEIMKNTRLVLQGERRPVKDSLLAYAGTVDHVTGETWGAVTKNGGGVGLNFDNGKTGVYGSVAEHRYEGENVDSNKALSMEIGGYFRPELSLSEQLQLGVHVGYNSFDKNLSKFTFGHGGYFSPQDYVSVAFPMNYGIEMEDMRFSVLFAPGFQSYSEDGNGFFPTDAAAQAALDLFYALGAIRQAGYAASSKSGFGLSFGATGEYMPQPYLRVGGQIGFDSFGDYNETSFRLYMKYLIGGSND
jgi:tetratricopeptide (TPR) repeat protein